jgi:hypothetical protein
MTWKDYKTIFLSKGRIYFKLIGQQNVAKCCVKKLKLILACSDVFHEI